MNFKNLKILFLGIFMSGAIMAALAATAVEKHGALTTDGTHILNKNGNIVQLRGMSFYWSTSGWGDGYSYYNAGTVKSLVNDWKCTVVRAAYDRNNGNNNGWEGVQAVIQAAIDNGIYVIIDWHSHTAFKQEAAAVAFFKEQAAKYKNTPNVIFEPFNEPISLDVFDPKQASDGSQKTAEKTWAGIKGYLKNVTQAIRDAGSNNLVVLGTPYFCQFVNVAGDDPVLDKNGNPFKNVAYSFHFYAASHGPFAYYVQESSKTGTTVGGMESSYLSTGLANVPVFITEWGTTHSDGAQKIDETNTKWWFDEYINKYHLSWCNWSVSTMETSSAFSSGTSPSASGTVVRKFLLNQSTDEYPAVAESVGPAGDTVFTIPAVHPLNRYNRYIGANFSPTQIPFLDWDKADGRTAANQCIKVLPGASNDYVSYLFKSTAATSKFVIRYLAKSGGGTLNFSLDKVSTGTLTVTKGAGWVTKVLDMPVAAGEHTFKINFNSATEEGFLLEWIEFTNNPVSANQTRKVTALQNSMTALFTPLRNGFTMSLPDNHGISGYRVMNSAGRLVRSGTISNTNTVSVNDLPAGIMFVKLAGLNSESYRIVVDGR